MRKLENRLKKKLLKLLMMLIKLNKLRLLRMLLTRLLIRLRLELRNPRKMLLQLRLLPIRQLLMLRPLEIKLLIPQKPPVIRPMLLLNLLKRKLMELRKKLRRPKTKPLMLMLRNE